MPEEAAQIEQSAEAPDAPAAEAPIEIPDGDRPIGEILEEMSDATAPVPADDEVEDAPAQAGDELLERIARNLEKPSAAPTEAATSATAPVKLSAALQKVLDADIDLFGEDSIEVQERRRDLESVQREMDTREAEIAPLLQERQRQQAARIKQTFDETEKFFRAKAKAGYADVFDWDQVTKMAASGKSHPFIELAAGLQNKMLDMGQAMSDDDARRAAFEILTRDHPVTKKMKGATDRAQKFSQQTSTPPARAGGAASARSDDPWARAKARLDALGIPD